MKCLRTTVRCVCQTNSPQLMSAFCVVGSKNLLTVHGMIPHSTLQASLDIKCVLSESLVGPLVTISPSFFFRQLPAAAVTVMNIDID